MREGVIVNLQSLFNHDKEAVSLALLAQLPLTAAYQRFHTLS